MICLYNDCGQHNSYNIHPKYLKSNFDPPVQYAGRVHRVGRIIIIQNETLNGNPASETLTTIIPFVSDIVI